MAVIFAVPTLKKTWECIPRSVSLKYKTAVLNFLLMLVLAKALIKKKKSAGCKCLLFIYIWMASETWDSIKDIFNSLGQLLKWYATFKIQYIFLHCCLPLYKSKGWGKKTLKLCISVWIVQFIWTWFFFTKLKTHSLGSYVYLLSRLGNNLAICGFWDDRSLKVPVF